MKNGNNVRDDKWTRSIAVGSEGFIRTIKSRMGAMAMERKSIKGGESFQLREDQSVYINNFEVKKSEIELENTYFWS